VGISRAGTALIVAGLLGIAGLTGCNPKTTTGSSSDNNAPSGSALAAVKDLTVKGRAPKTGYSRAQFGKSWVDTDHNSCDTRVISMIRRVTEIFMQLKPGVVGCAY
jgi:hypothetical protein